MTTPGTSLSKPPTAAIPTGRRGGPRLALALALAVAPSGVLRVEVPGGPSGSPSTLRFLEDRVASDPLDFVAANRLAGRYLSLLRETGDLTYLDRADDKARASLASVPGERNAGGLAVLALVEFESHHFAEALPLAKRAYAIDPRRLDALGTAGDAALELGRYAEAARLYARLATNAETPPVLARRARLAELKGQVVEAMALLRHDPAALLRSGVSARDVAWYQVRRGELYFRRGDFDHAEEQYRAALATCPDDISALEHLAELRGAQGHFDESAASYLALVARVPRAEFFQELGDLYAAMGDRDRAAPWLAKALLAYRHSIDEGHVYYIHHLAGFYSDSEEDPAEAVRWARKDLELRRSIFAYDALAWALYKNGDYEEASRTADKAVETGTRDAHLLYHAGLIYSRAGELDKGRSYLRLTAAANPRYSAFHVHR